MSRHHSPHMSDMHRRNSDAQREAELIRSQNQRRRNAEEWLRRSDKAYALGLYALARRLFQQAKEELHATPWVLTSYGAII